MNTMHEWSGPRRRFIYQSNKGCPGDSEKISGDCSLYGISDSVISHYRTELSGNNGMDQSGKNRGQVDVLHHQKWKVGRIVIIQRAVSSFNPYHYREQRRWLIKQQSCGVINECLARMCFKRTQGWIIGKPWPATPNKSCYPLPISWIWASFQTWKLLM